MQEICIILNCTYDDDTIIIIDEIQACPRALTALKYFYEDNTPNKIIATGSFWLEHMTQKSSFPVGKVVILEMFPLTFMEFLDATNNEAIKEKILVDYKNISNPIHEKCLELFDLYTIIGGMPEAIATYTQYNNLELVKKILDSINNQYKIDFQKYADTPKITSLLNTIYDNIIPALNENKKIMLTDISEDGMRTIINPLEWLVASRIVVKSPIISSNTVPLIQHVKYSNFRLFLSDIGLLLAQTNYYTQKLTREQDFKYKGLVGENYVAIVFNRRYKMCYNFRKGKTEVDFMLELNGDIIPVEVKNTKNVSSKSLSAYIRANNLVKGYRISRLNLNEDKAIIDIPIYMIDTYEFAK